MGGEVDVKRIGQPVERIGSIGEPTVAVWLLEAPLPEPADADGWNDRQGRQFAPRKLRIVKVARDVVAVGDIGDVAVNLKPASPCFEDARQMHIQ